MIRFTVLYLNEVSILIQLFRFIEKCYYNGQLVEFFKENSLVYQFILPGGHYIEGYLRGALAASKIYRFPVASYAQPFVHESRDFTEGDMWSQVYEDQKEYNENH